MKLLLSNLVLVTKWTGIIIGMIVGVLGTVIGLSIPLVNAQITGDLNWLWLYLGYAGLTVIGVTIGITIHGRKKEAS